MNRRLNQFRHSLEHKLVDVFANVTVGAAGAVTLDTENSKGVLSITNDATGKYTFVFGSKQGTANVLDTYVKLLAVSATFVGASGAASLVAATSILADNSGDNTKASIQVVFADFAGAAVSPAEGEILHISFTFKDSKAP